MAVSIFLNIALYTVRYLLDKIRAAKLGIVDKKMLYLSVTGLKVFSVFFNLKTDFALLFPKIPF